RADRRIRIQGAGSKRVRRDACSRAQLKHGVSVPAHLFCTGADNIRGGRMTVGTGAFSGLSRIGQIAMIVHDLPRAVAFYRDVLGMRFLFEAPPKMAFFDCTGIRLMLSLPETAEFDHPGSIIYYTVEDIQAAAAVLESRGVALDSPPHVVARLPHADLWMTFFRDPDSNVLAMMSEVTR